MRNVSSNRLGGHANKDEGCFFLQRGRTTASGGHPTRVEFTSRILTKLSTSHGVSDDISMVQGALAC